MSARQPFTLGTLTQRPLIQPMTAPRESSGSLTDEAEQRLSDFLFGLIVGACLGGVFALGAVRLFARMAA